MIASILFEEDRRPQALAALVEIARHRVDPHAQWMRASDNGLSGYDAAYLALAAVFGEEKALLS